MVTEACRVCYIVLGFFAVSLTITQSYLGENVLEYPHLGRLGAVLNVLSL